MLWQKKFGLGKKELVKFGIQNCYLNENEANEIYELCIKALKNSIFELEEYLKNDKSFEEDWNKDVKYWGNYHLMKKHIRRYQMKLYEIGQKIRIFKRRKKTNSRRTCKYLWNK